MMLLRSCQSLLSLLLRPQMAPDRMPTVAALATRSVAAAAKQRQKQQQKKGAIIREVQNEEWNNPGYTEELADTNLMMAHTESSTGVGAAFRARIRSEQKAIIKRSVARRQAAKLRPPEANLLTWAAKRQLSELAANEPHLWSPSALAMAFPVSLAQATTLVRNAQRGYVGLRSAEAIYRHDRRVVESLRKLKAIEKEKGRTPTAEEIEPGFSWLVRSDKWHLLQHAAGNVVLPLPQKHLIEDALEAEARRPLGPFEALAKAHTNAVAVADSSRRRQNRLSAFIACCERQKAEVEEAVGGFSTADTKELYSATGLLAKSKTSSVTVASQSAQESEFRPHDHMTMFAAVVAAPQAQTKQEETPVVAAAAADSTNEGKSFGELVEQLEAADHLSATGNLPKSNSALDKVRRPLHYRSRVKMQDLQIFRYSFLPERDSELT